MKASSFTLLLLCFSDLLPAQVQKKKESRAYLVQQRERVTVTWHF